MPESIFHKIHINLDTLEVFVLAFLVFLGVLSERLLPLAAIAGIVFLLIRLAWRRRIRMFWPVDLPVLILLAMLALSMFVVTALPEKSAPQALRLLGGIWLFYAVIRWGRISARRFGLAAVGYLGVGLALSVGAFFTVDWFTKFSFIPIGLIKAITPVISDTVQPNVLAGSLVLILAGMAGGLVFGWKVLRKWQQILLVVMLLFMTGILVLTQSRGALMGLGAGLLLMIMLRFRRGWIAVPVCLVLLVGLVLAVGPDRFFGSLDQTQSQVSSLEGREEIWSRAVMMIGDFPFTGIGIGTFGNVADTLYPFFLNSPGSVPHAHNLYLQVAVDLGIPGLAAWLAIWGSVIYSAWKLFQTGIKHSIAWQAALGAALLCTQVAMGVHGLWDAVTWGTRPAVLVWAIWGTAIAGRYYLKSHLRDIPQTDLEYQ